MCHEISLFYFFKHLFVGHTKTQTKVCICVAYIRKVNKEFQIILFYRNPDVPCTVL